MGGVGRRGFLGSVAGVVAGAAAAAKPVPSAPAPVYAAVNGVSGRQVVSGLVVVRVDDATMAKIEAGPTGPVANGFGARYFDGGAPEPVVVPESARAARARLSAVTVDGRARAWGVAGPPGLIGDGGRRGRRAT